MTAMLSLAEKTQTTVTIIISCLLSGAVYLPILRRMTLVGYDYLVHMGLAEKMLTSGSLQTPHFLLQFAVATLCALTPLAVQGATVTLLLTAVMGAALVISRQLLRLPVSPLATICLTIALLSAAPLAILFPLDRHLYLGYISTNVFHNPTIILLKPLALISFAYAVKAVADKSPALKRQLFFCALATVGCALTKPSFTICILPAMALMLLFRLYQRDLPDWRLPLIGFFLPALVVLALQFQMTYGAEQIQGVYSGSSKIIFSPLTVMSSFSPWLFPKLLLSLAFPLALLACYYRKAIRDTGLQLGWTAFMIGGAYTYLLAEAGPRMFQGNFTWSAQITLFILFIYSTGFLFREEIRSDKTGRRRFYFCTTLLCSHLLFGLAFYLSEFMHTERYW